MARSQELLDEYQKKRDFKKTAEPSGKPTAGKKGKARSFVVQKHDATRLHYDFRLELDGVLKSWAVTKGPSTNPADKRLAVRVEDHPLDYGDFEGTIPKGEYGGGTVMLWDEGTWEPIGDPHEGLQKGDLKFALHGKRMKGEWVLVHMKGKDAKRRNGEARENWLLIKHRDNHAAEADGLTEKFTTSVETGRDLEGIAKGLKSRRKTGKEAPRSRVWTNSGASKAVRFAKPSSTPLSAKPATKSKSRAKLKGMELTDEMGVAAAKHLGIKLTSPERVVYPDDGVTKAKLIAYYAAVSERMLQYVGERPLSLVRGPQGLKGQTFFQKHDNGGFPDIVKKIPIEEKVEEGTKDHMYVTNAGGLAACVQMNTLEFHIWGATIRNVEKAERIIFDIDPDEGLAFAEVKSAAMHIRDALGQWSLESFPMVTGGKGIHVIAPVKAITEWPLVKDFCHAFADKLEATQPERFTSNIRKVKRKGRMFVDYLRNERGSTAIGPFSTRARKGAPVAVPISWDEVETLDSANAFTLETAAARAQEKDPWPNYFKLTQSITKGMVEAVAGPVK